MEEEIALRVSRLLKRSRIAQEDILYMTHSAQQTLLHLMDGRQVITAVPLKTVAACFPPEDFWSIQKGVVVARRHVLRIENDGTYYMVDGRVFSGRTRNPAEHRRRRTLLSAAAPRSGGDFQGPPLPECCSLMDQAPLPFCLAQLVMDPDQQGVDFVIRYCNKAMESLCGTSPEDMLNRSFLQIFPGENRRWVIPCTDVALNGAARTIQDRNQRVGGELTITCYQPQPGYCACLVTQGIHAVSK